jgi:RNA 3'-terminal phosphate cyclase (ATP)
MMLTIDGSFGEGGGQILRTSLALSVITRTPFRMKKIRANRKKPGLMRQHLTCVKAAARISSAKVEGDALNSQEIVFEPQTLDAGHYEFAISTAGSTMLVLQTIFPALLLAKEPSQIVLSGGTHNDKAPSADFLKRAFFPMLQRMGCEAHLELKRYGFYPAGGGVVEVTINPIKRWSALEMMDAGEVVRTKAEVLLSRIPIDVAQRELKTLSRKLQIDANPKFIRQIRDCSGPGNVLSVMVERDKLTEVFTGYGAYGKPAETVAKQVIAQVRGYMKTGVAVGAHLADQLMLPMVLAGAGRFSTVNPSLHSQTNIEIIRKFLNVEMKLAPLADQSNQWGFAVGPDIERTNFAETAVPVEA